MLNSVLLDLPAGSQIDLQDYLLESDYSYPALVTQHFRLRVALDTATPQKTMHAIIFGDHTRARAAQSSQTTGRLNYILHACAQSPTASRRTE